ncbi:hypothetical protein [Streptomyces lydicus]|uniref:hypothetical protein n=1 Tax=Streptomyces lydicus TaxID=47763 RepID=UPI00370282F5
MTPPTAASTPPPVLLGDAEVRARLTPATATAAVRHALLEHQAGRLAAPPRVHAGLGGGELVFTVGALAAEGTTHGIPGVHGFRAYGTADRAGEQLAAVWDSASGRLIAVVHGHELGPRQDRGDRGGGGRGPGAHRRPGGLPARTDRHGPAGWAQLWALSASASHRPAEVAVAAALTRT